MIWRRFRDWREQRAAMREFARIQREDEASLVMELANPLSLAQTAARAGKLTEAAAYWEEAHSLRAGRNRRRCSNRAMVSATGAGR
jgi:hypothetical protein